LKWFYEKESLKKQVVFHQNYILQQSEKVGRLDTHRTNSMNHRWIVRMYA